LALTRAVTTTPATRATKPSWISTDEITYRSPRAVGVPRTPRPGSGGRWGPGRCPARRAVPGSGSVPRLGCRGRWCGRGSCP
jgi:hypothetical protein